MSMNSPLPARQRAIDVMRGLTLALMMVVNAGISDEQTYSILAHAAWNGLTLADLVFPLFLFVVGAAMSFTRHRYQGATEQTQGTGVWASKVARRTALIFLCGYLLYWFPFFTHDGAGQLVLKPWADTRIPGVLQRIAICYGLAACVIHVGGSRGVVVWSVLTLLLYAVLLRVGGDDTMGGNVVVKVDRWLLGESHLYKGEGIPFDPEGLLSSWPAVVNVLAGWWAGQQLQELGATPHTMKRLALAAVACTALALVWNELQPFNKKLWTSSYVLVGIGASMGVLAVLIRMVDLRPHPGPWASFFEVFGRNTLALYLMCELSMVVLWLLPVQGQPAMLWIYEHGFQRWAGDKPGSLLFAMAFMGVWWCVGWIMDQRKI
jgi:predicted acyltransferase